MRPPSSSKEKTEGGPILTADYVGDLATVGRMEPCVESDKRRGETTLAEARTKGGLGRGHVPPLRAECTVGERGAGLRRDNGTFGLAVGDVLKVLYVVFLGCTSAVRWCGAVYILPTSQTQVEE
jgi:hypothetical protein